MRRGSILQFMWTLRILADGRRKSTTCHTSRATMCGLSLLFRDRIISKGLWPPHSPDLSPPDFFLWGYIKDNAYHNNSHSPDLSPPDFFLWGYIKDNAYHNNSRNLDELKTNISNIITDISLMMLQAVTVNMLHHARIWMQHAGAHFQNLL
jgi:hypothetical protein